MESVNERDFTFGYADRFDEKYDLVRSCRKGNFKYIRNYQPYHPDALFNAYRYRQMAYREWKKLYKEEKLNPVQSAFFERKPSEMLFDLDTDPYETTNLATLPEYADILQSMRILLKEQLTALPDLSFIPESVFLRKAVTDPVVFGKKNQSSMYKIFS